MFIHDAILESITCGNTQVSAADLQRALTKLKQRDPHTKLTGYEQQYKVLCDISIQLGDFEKDHKVVVTYIATFYI